MSAPGYFAKLIAFLIAPEGAPWGELWRELSPLGEIDHEGAQFPFSGTDYYNEEMGEKLNRRVVSFKGLIPPECIAEHKRIAIGIEARLRNPRGGRLLNIDAGYMDSDKVVLPSAKRGPFKLYAGGGIWLDMILSYAKGSFKPTAWAFPDFQENPYKRDLLLIREKFKREMRSTDLGAEAPSMEIAHTKFSQVSTTDLLPQTKNKN